MMTARRRPPADGVQRKLKLGDQPSDKICAKEEEKQASQKKHVIEGTHSRLFLQVLRVGASHQAQRRGRATLCRHCPGAIHEDHDDSIEEK